MTGPMVELTYFKLEKTISNQSETETARAKPFLSDGYLKRVTLAVNVNWFSLLL